MKTIFVINPKAGKGKGLKEFAESVRKSAERLDILAEIYYTKAAGDASVFVEKTIRAFPEEEIRFYICGGDGTMNEAVNGLYLAEDAADPEKIAFGLVPIGSGNDFIKSFWDYHDAMDLEKQLHAHPVYSDVLFYENSVKGEKRKGLCCNMFNIGFDANVVDMRDHLNKSPLISGSFAYLLGVMVTFIKKKGADLRIEADGELLYDGPLLLSSIANGPFCGGGIKSNPTARIDDGLMDVNVVKDVSRTYFLKLFPQYQKGTHMSMPNIDQTIKTTRCRMLKITPKSEGARLCIDGEMTDAGQITITMKEKAFRFLAP